MSREIREKTVVKRERIGKRCGGTPSQPRRCCQALTQSGTKCTRESSVQLDLTGGRQFLFYKIPAIKCCFLCTQHAAIMMGVAIGQISNMVAMSKYEWNDYLVLQPEYLTSKLQEIRV